MKVARMVRGKWNRFRERRRQAIRIMAKCDANANTRCRAQIIVALVQERKVAEIVNFLQCSKSLVYKVAHDFVENAEVAFADRREENGEVAATPVVDEALWTMVAATPREFGCRRTTWTLELLAIVLRQRVGVKLSRSTISRALRRLGIRLGRPKPFVKCPWRKGRKNERIRRIYYLLRNAREGEVWVFEDEVDIHLNPKIGPDYMLPATQKKVSTPGKNQKAYLAGAVNAFTGQLTWVIGEKKNSELFMRLVFQLGHAYPGVKRVHLIVDNYSIHKSHFTKLILASCDGKVRLHFLPPYCPDNNRIERVWRDLHDNVTRNHQNADMSALLKEVRYWLRKESKRLKRRFEKEDPAQVYTLAV